ncbi:MAG: hypothetical protein OXQ86_06745, partial [Gammaproteobacteria bacterium]|nr:hypothetical protein [Gammaproteobacteria bacterium]
MQRNLCAATSYRIGRHRVKGNRQIARVLRVFHLSAAHTETQPKHGMPEGAFDALEELERTMGIEPTSSAWEAEV